MPAAVILEEKGAALECALQPIDMGVVEDFRDRFIALANRCDRDLVPARSEGFGEHLDVPLFPADDGGIELGQEEDAHQCPFSTGRAFAAASAPGLAKGFG